MVKLHELILIFDTNKPDDQVEKQALALIEEINKLICRSFKDSFPQIYKDPKRKSKISIVPASPEDSED